MNPSTVSLKAALKFVAVSGATYCEIANNMVTAVTDHISIGCPIEESLNARANIKMLYNSIDKSTGKIAITQLELSKLHVDNGDFQSYVNCDDEIKHAIADPITIQFDNDIAGMLKIACEIALTNSVKEAAKSICIYGTSIFATNAFGMVEFWNEVPMPFVLISKKTASLIVKTKKKVTGFGYSQNSNTFYFEDGSWIMARSFYVDWPNPNEFLPTEDASPISDEFVKAVITLKPFAKGSLLYGRAGRLSTACGQEEGASMPFPGVLEGAIYGADDLLFVAKHADKVLFRENGYIAFYGNGIRGIISNRKGM